MYIAILGRQPALGMAELECIYGSERTAWLSQTCAKVNHEGFNFDRLGGSRKAGRIITEFPGLPWRSLSKKIIQHYQTAWADLDHKLTVGISTYDCDATAHDIQRLGLDLKRVARANGGSLRLIPNHEAELSTATSHHNKLGLSPNKIELLIIRTSNGRTILAESVGSQNITAFAARDQARPKTDAFVGMLPPKLARMMVNMAAGEMVGGRWYMVDGDDGDNSGQAIALTSDASRPSRSKDSAFPAEPGTRTASASGPSVPEPSDGSGASRKPSTILDPFCGTGVVLQEASLLGFAPYGTDHSEKMIDYSRTNLDWLAQRYTHIAPARIELGDATKHQWTGDIAAVASETYLGQPFSAPPAPDKLIAVRDNCDHIISTFLRTIAPQLATDTPLCLAVPAWRDAIGNVTHLPLIDNLEKLGYVRLALANVRPEQLLYYRENQIVARELLLLKRS